MGYLVLLFAALVFVLGFSQTTSLLSALAEPEQRRNLIYRVCAFFVMSAWLHLLPLMLISIYMRHQGILATEVFSEDEPRASLVALYMLPKVALFVLLLTLRPMINRLSSDPWKIKSWVWLLGIIVVAALLVQDAVESENLDGSIFLLLVSLPFAIYLWTAIATPLAQQIKRFWMPFLVILVVTVTAFWLEDRTHDLVRQQLSAFRSGGDVPVLIESKDFRLMGRLVLLTQKTAYVKTEFTPTLRPCIVRVPLASAYVATLTNRFTLSSSDFDDKFIKERTPDWQKLEKSAVQNLAEACGALVQRDVLGPNFKMAPTTK